MLLRRYAYLLAALTFRLFSLLPLFVMPFRHVADIVTLLLRHFFSVATFCCHISADISFICHPAAPRHLRSMISLSGAFFLHCLPP